MATQFELMSSNVDRHMLESSMTLALVDNPEKYLSADPNVGNIDTTTHNNIKLHSNITMLFNLNAIPMTVIQNQQ